MRITLEQLNKIAGGELQSDGGWPTEFNRNHNRISRAEIRAMKREQGACFIWNMNPWDKEETKVCTEYKKGMAFNFCGSFITSKYDTHLEKLMSDRLSAKWTAKDDMKRIDNIFAYAEKLNYIVLIWS